MQAPNHSPTPWHVESDVDGYKIVANDRNLEIATVHFTDKTGHNARLLVNAPAMLATLKRVKSMFESLQREDILMAPGVVSDITEVIEKAEIQLPESS